MGTWAHGNFDNDAALDWLGETTKKLLDEIQVAMDAPERLQADEWDADIVPCKIELLCVMSEAGLHPHWPEKSTLEQWKTTYLNAWDSSIDGLDPDPEYKMQRRITLVKTFNRMLHCADLNKA